MKTVQKILALAMVGSALMTTAAYADVNDPTQPPPQEQQAQGGQQLHHDHDMFPGLSDDGKAILHSSMKQTHEQNKTVWEQSRKDEHDLQAIIAADKFDAKAFAAKQAELAKLHEKMHASMTKAFAAALSQLSPDDRKIIASDMEKREHMHTWHHEHGHDGGKPQTDDQGQ